MGPIIIILITLGVIAGIFLIWILFGIKVVTETNFMVIERFGKYCKTWERGIHFYLPGIYKVAKKDNKKEKFIDLNVKHVITKDNAILIIDAVVYYQIFEPKLYAYGAENPTLAIETLTSTTLRNFIGEMNLDESLSSREKINAKLTGILDEATDPWGIKVVRVEIQEIIPPRDISDAMAKQMTAEREKRAEIFKAEGQKAKEILEAEGKKQSLILKAEGEKNARILEAEGKKKAIELLEMSNPSEKILIYKAIEQLGVIADGKATKIILPPDLINTAKAMTTFQIFKENEEENPTSKIRK